jgi:hypothetical protein
MNHRIIEGIWKKLSKTRTGRFFAATIIGGLFGLSAGVSQSHDQSTWALAALGGAVIAVVAVGILEALDSGRSGARTVQDDKRPPVIPK